MMTNLFSMFDPSTTILNLPMNWMSIIMGTFSIPMIYWLIPNNYSLIYNKMLSILYKEFKTTIANKNSNSSTLIFITLFIFIMFNNFFGLFPYIFTSTSHLVFNLTITLPFWMSYLIFGWLNNTNHMFTHLVPRGTPPQLIFFMVCIETISNLIRPITLTVRLTANMIAGHLLLTLLSSMGSKLMEIFVPFVLIVQIVLLLLESAVAFIQAYVFALLITLYFMEVE